MEPSLRTLLSQYFSGKITISDRGILFLMLQDDHNGAEARNILQELIENTSAEINYQESEWQSMIQSILRVRSATPVAPVNRISIFNKIWFRYAASIVIIMGVAAVARLIKIDGKQPVATVKTEKPKVNDVAPGSNKAVLILSTGQKIILNSTKNGQLARFGNTVISKTDSGKLIYASTGSEVSSYETSFNTLITPRGGIYQLTLPDGTIAWLNAESRIDYPMRFGNKKREVFIDGEVYFEVAKDKKHPFIVSKSAKSRAQGENGHWMQIEVLGTHFNVDAYHDYIEEPVKTTLLEGSVKITTWKDSLKIKPGQQASTGFSHPFISVDNNVDLEKVMAWKNGEMVLNNGDVEQLMREISRWYDVDVEYKGTIQAKKFYGSINRNVPLSNVLSVLKAYGIETRLENKKLIVF